MDAIDQIRPVRLARRLSDTIDILREGRDRGAPIVSQRTLRERLRTPSPWLVRTNILTLRSYGFVIRNHHGKGYELVSEVPYSVSSNMATDVARAREEILDALTVLMPTFRRLNLPELRPLVEAWDGFNALISDEFRPEKVS